MSQHVLFPGQRTVTVYCDGQRGTARHEWDGYYRCGVCGELLPRTVTPDCGASA